MSLDLSALEGTLTDLTTVVDGVVALINKMAEDVTANAGNQAKVTEIAEAYRAQAQELADAVVAHTPGAPPEGGNRSTRAAQAARRG